MTAEAVLTRVHPLHRFAGRLLAALEELGLPSLWSMTAGEATETIAELGEAGPRLQALLLAVVADADRTDLASSVGKVNAAALVRSLTKLSGPAATRMVKTARAVDAHEDTQAALVAGRIEVEQAIAIAEAVDALPSSVSPADCRRAELHLLTEAVSHDALALRALGRHLIDVIDPDAADERLAAALEAEEKRAARKTFLKLKDCGDGTFEGRFKIGTLHKAMLTRMLDALSNPARPEPIDPEGRSREEVRGQAFCQLLERYPTSGLPTSGGVNATVVVTIPLATLLGGLDPATLDTGEQISPSLARRLACEAGVIPMVLGSDSVVLDEGRRVRYHTPKQRLAMNVQQHGTCAVQDCDRPAWWCDGHHLTPWSAGGQTSVHDGVLICPRHHTLAHHPRFELTIVRPGRARLVRRQ